MAARRIRQVSERSDHAGGPAALPGQVVLVLQGGGALGAYQLGVYEALHEAGVEPDWVIGTSIGAINGALIAGNAPQDRWERLCEFWRRVERPERGDLWRLLTGIPNAAGNLATVTDGVSTFFAPNPAAWFGPRANVGVENAAYYTTAPLRETLSELVDFDLLDRAATRLTVGAVNVRTGEMRYFDSRDERVGLEHVLASGALPPAFPAVRIGGDPYWDGGIYSNTPIEAVFDDKPRRDSIIFTVNVWNPEGPEPESIWQVLGRQKDIQYASRAKSHIARQQQIHHLRHIIRELDKHLPASVRELSKVKELTAWGCGTVMHVARLVAPRLPGEDHTKDIDFSAAGIGARRRAGCDDVRRMLAAAPWTRPFDPVEGVVIHGTAAHGAPPLARVSTDSATKPGRIRRP